MSHDSSPYVTRCSRCENGLLRLYRCAHCAAIAAICDECELVWRDVPRVSDDATAPSDTSFPACPHCQATRSAWTRLDIDSIREAQLDRYLAGEST